MRRVGATLFAVALLLSACGGQTTGDGGQTPAAQGTKPKVTQGDGKTEKNCTTQRAVTMCN